MEKIFEKDFSFCSYWFGENDNKNENDISLIRSLFLHSNEIVHFQTRFSNFFYFFHLNSSFSFSFSFFFEFGFFQKIGDFNKLKNLTISNKIRTNFPDFLSEITSLSSLTLFHSLIPSNLGFYFIF